MAGIPVPGLALSGLLLAMAGAAAALVWLFKRNKEKKTKKQAQFRRKALVSSAHAISDQFTIGEDRLKVKNSQNISCHLLAVNKNSIRTFLLPENNGGLLMKPVYWPTPELMKTEATSIFSYLFYWDCRYWTVIV